ncbi:hypothetical protein [uncultured Acinetobacter sp.]|uniref:hypothetical protein n=1 Tax=uncultured Acinetobacter sp. TaxID=165433 RepID=UPI0026124516|nr:hypothetical protein [uncultured Acinetobacter sp.]
MSMFKTLFFLNEVDKNEQNARKISNQNNEIYDKNTEIGKLKKQLKDTEEKLAKAKQANDVPEWKVRELYKQQSLNKELQKEIDYYKSLLTKPMLEIAKQDKRFKINYEKQQAILSKFIIESSAMKELAQQYGIELGKSDEDFSQNLDNARDKVLNNESDFGNNVDQSTVSAIEKDKHNLIEEELRLQRIKEQEEKNQEYINSWSKRAEKI